MQNKFTPVSSEQPRYRSGAVARMVRIPVSTLRIWERRYQVVGPALTDSGHRLYSGADVERLLLIKQLIDLGHAIGSLARLPTPALLEIADARAALDNPALAGPAERTRTVLLGLGLPRRLGVLPLQRVAVWADLASAEAAMVDGDALAGLQADLLVADLATLLPESATRLLALMQRLGVQRALVVYGFGNESATQRLRQAGCRLHRAPLAEAELRTQVTELLALPGAADAAAPATGRPSLPAAVPPRRFDDAALLQMAAVSTTVACECPRHVAELVMLLGNFETYSAECVNRSTSDAELHAHLHWVAGQARALFEDALQRVAEAEGILLLNRNAPPAGASPS
jgi:hypothetical protein